MLTRVAGIVVATALVVAGILWISPDARFVTGGALVNAGFKMQDGLHSFDFEHGEDITPAQVWEEFLDHNSMSSAVRRLFPRTTFHPTMAMLVCMDARIDTSELAGDTRRNIYVLRTAGSVMSPQEEDMLELAVESGVKVIAVTRHTDCAAEKAAADPVRSKLYPSLVEALGERDERLREFLARPVVARRIAEGHLMVKTLLIDTSTEQLSEVPAADDVASR